MKKISVILIVVLLAFFVIAFTNCSKAPTGGDNNAITNGQNTTPPELSKRNPPDPQEKLLRRLNNITERLNKIGTRLEEVINGIVEPKDPGIIDQLNNIRTEASWTIDFCNNQILQLGRGGQPALLDALNNLITTANHIIELVDASLANTGRGFPVDQPRIARHLENIAHKLARINHHLEHLFQPPSESDDSFSRDDD